MTSRVVKGKAMTEQAMILICDDEVDAAQFIGMELEVEGYRVEMAHDGQAGLIKFREVQPDLVLLDWDMPKMSGVDVCKRIRRGSDVPILMLTAKSEIEHKVFGLDSGANDYLVKPFELDELLARVRALLRLRQPVQVQELSYVDLVMDLKLHSVRRGDKGLDLSPKEFEILKYLLEHPEQVLSKEQIYDRVWGWESDNLDVVEVYISTLRRKMEEGGLPRLVHTRRGFGYLLHQKS